MTVLSTTADKLADAGNLVYKRFAQSAFVTHAREIRNRLDTWNEERKAPAYDFATDHFAKAHKDFRGEQASHVALVSATARTAGWKVAQIGTGAVSLATRAVVWATGFAAYTATVRAPKMVVALGVWLPLHVAAGAVDTVDAGRALTVWAARHVARFGQAARTKWIEISERSKAARTAAKGEAEVTEVEPAVAVEATATPAVETPVTPAAPAPAVETPAAAAAPEAPSTQQRVALAGRPVATRQIVRGGLE